MVNNFVQIPSLRGYSFLLFKTLLDSWLISNLKCKIEVNICIYEKNGSTFITSYVVGGYRMDH